MLRADKLIGRTGRFGRRPSSAGRNGATAKPFLSQANLVQRREKQIGSPGLRFEWIQIRQNTRTHTLKMRFPLQGRFLSLLKREVVDVRRRVQMRPEEP